MQAPLGALDSAPAAGHVLEIPRQLKYQRKRKHGAPAALHVIQARCRVYAGTPEALYRKHGSPAALCCIPPRPSTQRDPMASPQALDRFVGPGLGGLHNISNSRLKLLTT